MDLDITDLDMLDLDMLDLDMLDLEDILDIPMVLSLL